MQSLKLPMIFSNHMVLQRQKPCAIWGWAEPGCEVQVEIQNNVKKVQADAGGKWIAYICPLEVSWGNVLNISAGGKQVSIKDVAVGEVWLAGGQSNMEFYLKNDADADVVKGQAPYKNIRFFDCPKVSYESQIDELDYSRFGIWREADGENLDYFSAVGFYFSKRLEEYLGIPIGIVGCNWGGTPACTWIEESYLNGAAHEWVADYEKVVKERNLYPGTAEFHRYEQIFKSNPMNDHSNPFGGLLYEQEEKMKGMSPAGREAFMMSMWATLPNPAEMVGPYCERRPSGLYHMMLEKLIPYTLRGILWYQGEADDEKAGIYEDMMCALIRCWREKWGEDLPFLFVQLAPFEQWMTCNGVYYPQLRRQQEIVSKKLAGTYMASIGDVGMRYDIHPKRKRPVGERLALLAIGHVYGENILCDAPEAVFAEVEKSRIRIHFQHARGLYINGDHINALEVRVGQELLAENTDYTAWIDNCCMVIEFVNGLERDGEVEVHFADSPYYEVNVYNLTDIPVKPFVMRVPSLS